MKKSILILITLSMLLQSCFSYRTINPTNSYLAVGRTYKIKQNNKYEKVKLKSFTDSTITVSNGLTERQVDKTSILKMKQRESHTGKTVMFVATATVVGLVGLFVATYKGPQIGGSMQMPP